MGRICKHRQICASARARGVIELIGDYVDFVKKFVLVCFKLRPWFHEILTIVFDSDADFLIDRSFTAVYDMWNGAGLNILELVKLGTSDFKQ